MSAPDHKEIAESWLTVQRHWWAYQAMCKLVEASPEEALSLILVVLERASSPNDLADIGSGPLEDLLRLHAIAVIDKVETLAKSNPAMRTALSHVWFSQGDTKLNERLEALGCRIISIKGAGDDA
jgi:hypothetical protein